MMLRSLIAVGIISLGSACNCDGPLGPSKSVPPDVFLTVDEPNIIGGAVTGKIVVTGCESVTQVDILEGGLFLAAVNYAQNPTPFSLSPELLNLRFRKGIAAALTLSARAVCDDTRNSTSQTVGARFFPVANRWKASDGSQLVPDRFVAEGGLNGPSTATFLGCVRSDTGNVLARVNTQGAVTGQVTGQPFDCSLGTVISERSAVTGTRWVLEPGVGGYAIDASLQVLKVLRAQNAARMGVGPKGSAVFWINEVGSQQRLEKVDPIPSTANDWAVRSQLVGIMSADPVIDDGAGSAVYAVDRRYDVGTKVADTVFFKFDLQTGALLNGVVNGRPPVIFRQQFPMTTASFPVDQDGAISADGSLYVRPVLTVDTQNNVRTSVVACATALGLCEDSGRRWTSPALPGETRLVVPFAGGNMYAAVGPFHVYFLDAQLGTLLNLGGAPIQPSGTQVVVGVHAGSGADFYVLTGPDLGPMRASYATEIIAVDHPASGELWKLSYGSGETSAAAMYIAIDDSAQTWVRAGIDLLQLGSNARYREMRGATVLP